MEVREVQLLTLQEVAEKLAVSIPTLRTWEKKGHIKFIRLPSGTIRIRSDELEERYKQWQEQG